MKILCVGLNYAEHNEALEQGNKAASSALLHQEPVIFTKPDSALVKEGRPFFVPDFAERFDYEAELIVRIAHVGKDIAPRFAHRYYHEVTVGIDFTARDLQSQLRAKGLPWDLCKGFDGSAVVGQFIDTAELPDIQDLHFRLDINGETAQRGHTANMLHKVDDIVSYCSRFFTLKTGDLIFTGTPTGTAPVTEGQYLEGYLEERRVLSCRVK